MKKPMHSPGPWSVGFPGNVINHARGNIGAVNSHPHNGEGAKEEGDANIALIAAAPELLAAALRSLAFMEKRGIGMGEHDLRMAVGKALGLSPSGVSEVVKAEGGVL